MTYCKFLYCVQMFRHYDIDLNSAQDSNQGAVFYLLHTLYRLDGHTELKRHIAHDKPNRHYTRVCVIRLNNTHGLLNRVRRVVLLQTVECKKLCAIGHTVC
jgi:hypothetical protein